jgi:hypothetical protein
MSSRLPAFTWHRLLRSLLLPLLLAFAQQGALLHELSHWPGAEAQQRDVQAPGSEACGVCLAFAGIDSGAAPASAPAPLLADLSDAPAPLVLAAQIAAELPAERGRGPPLL